jgi:hypothetical protein
MRVEQQHGDRIGEPVLLARRIDACNAIDRALDG